ncbi:MAG: hypothetical protein AAB585_01080 [Patescibacteria group bacterium]
MPEESELQPEGRMWLLVILMLVIFAGSLFYFIRNNPDILNSDRQARISQNNNRQTRIYTVFYNPGVFSPTNLRIHIGDAVKFQNDGDQPIHISPDEPNNPIGFDSIGDVPPRSSFAYTFSKQGVFGYYNSLNKSERGTVIVRP